MWPLNFYQKSNQSKLVGTKRTNHKVLYFQKFPFHDCFIRNCFSHRNMIWYLHFLAYVPIRDFSEQDLICTTKLQDYSGEHLLSRIFAKPYRNCPCAYQTHGLRESFSPRIPNLEHRLRIRVHCAGYRDQSNIRSYISAIWFVES